MPSKYDELSGEGPVLSCTPYGVLMELIRTSPRPVIAVASNAPEVTFDGTSWLGVNPGLYQRLLEYAKWRWPGIVVCEFASDLARDLLSPHKEGEAAPASAPPKPNLSLQDSGWSPYSVIDEDEARKAELFARNMKLLTKVDLADALGLPKDEDDWPSFPPSDGGGGR